MIHVDETQCTCWRYNWFLLTETSSVLSEDTKKVQSTGTSKKHQLTNLQLADLPVQQQIVEACVVGRQNIKEKCF